MASPVTRRKALASGLGGITVVAAGGLVWRAWDNGVFSVGAGPAYQPWDNWRGEPLEGSMALVRAGILAANAHNTQPWRFRVGPNRVALYADPQRHLGSFDPFRRELCLSLGCALENMVQAARAQGHDARIEISEGLTSGISARAGEPVAILNLAPGATAETELFRAIPRRHTHRGAYTAERRVPRQLIDEMQTLVGPDSPTLRLSLLDEGADKTRLGALIVSATQAIIADARMSSDSGRWFRLDWRAVRQHRDGVTLDALGLSTLLSVAAKILPAPSLQEADRLWLDATRDVHVATAPLLGVIAVRDLYDRPTAMSAGRLWQRLHLWATARGLVAQPLNQPAEMVDRERELGGPPRTAEALAALTGGPGWHPTFIFRAGYADRPAGLSPRRPVAVVVDA